MGFAPKVSNQQTTAQASGTRMAPGATNELPGLLADAVFSALPKQYFRLNGQLEPCDQFLNYSGPGKMQQEAPSRSEDKIARRGFGCAIHATAPLSFEPLKATERKAGPRIQTEAARSPSSPRPASQSQSLGLAAPSDPANGQVLDGGRTWAWCHGNSNFRRCDASLAAVLHLPPRRGKDPPTGP